MIAYAAHIHNKQVLRIRGQTVARAVTDFFKNAEDTVNFCRMVNSVYRIDVSAQTYKANCPPAALTKFPLVASETLLGFVIDAMDKTLTEMEVK